MLEDENSKKEYDWFVKYRTAYAFLEDNASYELFTPRMKNKATNIIPEKLALSDKAGELSISGVAGLASLSSSGIEKVKVMTIDKFVQDQKLDRVDFIKMDIEGAELDALKGGQETIKRFNFHLDFNKRYDKIIISCSNE
ncbi:MAG: FkbM family methyltransferase [Nitrososphaeria archaeon]